MALLKKTDDGYVFNDPCVEDQNLISKFLIAVEKNGFDNRAITYGVFPSPDFGYFDLANRYWTTSLCIYLSGGMGCFRESGVGFTEPWIYTVRHSFELTLKGLVLFSIWLDGTNKNPSQSGYVHCVNQLRKKFSSIHSLSKIYSDYRVKMEFVVEKWDGEIFGPMYPLGDLLLSTTNQELLNELDQLDPCGETFRYPSLKNNQEDRLQKLDWKYDEAQLFFATGLPKKSGCFFDHIKVVNSLHDLNIGVMQIKNLLNSIWDYIGDKQGYIKNSMSDFY